MKKMLKTTILPLSFWFLTASITMLAQTSTRPNIVIIMADDMGHGDLSITGGKTPTPNIDKILDQGVRFSNFMTNPVCSPTRGALMTGQHPLRIGAGPETGGNLDPRIVNFGNYFQKEGYNTGLFGKWHNSPSPNEVAGSNIINQYGFNRFVGFYAGAVDYFSKASTGWFHDDKLIENELEYSTDLISKYAIEFMDKSKNENKPFLCYVPFNAVHGPHVVKEELLKRVPTDILNKVKNPKTFDEYRRTVINIPEWKKYNAQKYNDDSWNAKLPDLSPEEKAMLYSAVILSLDDNVGLIMDYLKKNNLLENTIVLFLSDNGGTEYAGNNAPFRGFKHSLYEGGIHSAAAMMIPQTVLASPKKTIPEMCAALDVFPTLAELSKAKQKLPAHLDGISLVNLMKGKSSPKSTRYLYWAWRDHDVVRTDRWKLFRYADKVELYDLQNDIAESKDVSKDNPEVVKQMLEQVAIESKKYGVATIHQPLNIKPSPAKPEGKVLAIAISAENELKKQSIKIIKKDFTILADYYLEYDVKVDAQSDLSFCYFSPIRGTSGIFNEKMGVDLDGKLLQSPTAFDGNWKHVKVGLSSYSPLKFGDFALTYKFKKAGKTVVYFDNIRIKNLKGQVIYEIVADDVDKKSSKAANASMVDLQK
jgi:arylsulfatase A-like enzyme